MVVFQMELKDLYLVYLNRDKLLTRYPYSGKRKDANRILNRPQMYSHIIYL